MRTAEETYNSIIKNNRKGMSPMEIAIKCIRVAREDIVIECAKRAKAKPVIFSQLQRQNNCPAKVVSPVDKQSILNLIQELK